MWLKLEGVYTKMTDHNDKSDESQCLEGYNSIAALLKDPSEMIKASVDVAETMCSPAFVRGARAALADYNNTKDVPDAQHEQFSTTAEVRVYKDD